MGNTVESDSAMLQVYQVMKDGHWEVTSELPDRVEEREVDCALIWVDVLEPTEKVIREISEWVGHDPRLMMLSLSENEPTGIAREAEFTHIYMQAIRPGEPPNFVEYCPISINCSGHVIITLHPRPLVSIKMVQEVLPKIAKQIGRYGPGHLLFYLFDKMIDRCVLVAKSFEERLDILEDRSMSTERENRLLEDLSDVRREVVVLWRNCVTQREVLIELCEEEFDFLSEESVQRLERVRDHMSSTLQMVELLRGMINEVRENYRTTLNMQSSEATKKLTVFAGVLLPMSTIAALYGMNVPLWPNPNEPATFWQILTLMGTVAAVQMYFFWRLKWL
jgi:magnesium transporter